MSFIRGAKLDEHIAEIRQASVLVTSVRLQIEKAVELINLVHKEDSTSNLDKGEKNLDEMVKSMKDSVEVLNNFIQEWPNRSRIVLILDQKVQDPRETPNILGAFDTIRDLIYKIQDGSIMMVKLLMLYSDISRSSMSENEQTKIHEFTRQIDQNIDQFERLINRSQSDIDLNNLLDISKEFAARECRIQGGIEKIAEDCYSNLPSRRSLRGSPQKPEQSPSGMGYFIDRD
jgi:hypothetical protein